jgi:hypothetical protein
MVRLLRCHSNNRWRPEYRHYEAFSTPPPPIVLLHSHRGFSRNNWNRVLLGILRPSSHDFDL